MDNVKNAQLVTCNIAKSGEVLNWGDLQPFQLHLSLIVYLSQSASCHIATVGSKAITIIEDDII